MDAAEVKRITFVDSRVGHTSYTISTIDPARIAAILQWIQKNSKPGNLTRAFPARRTELRFELELKNSKVAVLSFFRENVSADGERWQLTDRQIDILLEIVAPKRNP